MRLAISNIAWDVSEDIEVARLLQRYGVDAIDIAPTKYFPEPKKADDAGIIQVRHWWENQGIEVTGMQSLLFGTTGLNLFGPPHVQKSMLEHFDAICRIGSGLDATRLVFGSPKNRDRSGLTDEQANAVAMEFFLRLADVATAYGVVICLEPNPANYGCNFMTSSVETAELVEKIANPAIRMQLDTGALTMNQEDLAAILARSALFIGHIHASEPDLVPLGDGGTEHGKFAALLTQTLPQHLVSIEMLATKDESHLGSIARALQVAIRHYRNNGNGKGTLE